jgi:hypothetical protein
VLAQPLGRRPARAKWAVAAAAAALGVAAHVVLYITVAVVQSGALSDGALIAALAAFGAVMPWTCSAACLLDRLPAASAGGSRPKQR